MFLSFSWKHITYIWVCKVISFYNKLTQLTKSFFYLILYFCPFKTKMHNFFFYYYWFIFLISIFKLILQLECRVKHILTFLVYTIFARKCSTINKLCNISVKRINVIKQLFTTEAIFEVISSTALFSNQRLINKYINTREKGRKSENLMKRSRIKDRWLSPPHFLLLWDYLNWNDCM